MNQRPLILAAEDDAEDRYIMNATFSELGYVDAIRLMDDGVDLMEYLATHGSAAVNLIILDLNMPRLSGTDTLRALKENSSYDHIPVIIFSTSINEIQKDICMELGAREYVVKPARYLEYMEMCRKFYSMSQC